MQMAQKFSLCRFHFNFRPNVKGYLVSYGRSPPQVDRSLKDSCKLIRRTHTRAGRPSGVPTLATAARWSHKPFAYPLIPDEQAAKEVAFHIDESGRALLLAELLKIEREKREAEGFAGECDCV